MNGTRDQFLSGSGFTTDKHGRVGRCDNFDLHEHPPKRHALAYDLTEVQFTWNFFLQIKLFLCELVLERLNLAVSEHVFHGDRYLVNNLHYELDILIVRRSSRFNDGRNKAPDTSMRSGQGKRA